MGDVQHIPVLLHEVLMGLDIQPSDRVFEGTVGLGGHGEEIMKHLDAEGLYIGTDEDAQALNIAQKRLAGYPCRKIFREENFRNLDRVLDKAGISHVNKILFDLGLSNLQLEGTGRGFSFKRDEPLIMSFKVVSRARAMTAREIVNEWAPESMVGIFEGYGEEKFAWRIAQAIVVARTKKLIETTAELSEIVRRAVPAFSRFGRIHPATKIFQALRIAVNDELGALREGLLKGFERLAPGGRMAVISFHSLEDRAVKTFFKKANNEGSATLITKRPVVPGETELAMNSKSRSAKLRIIQKK
jgi:16S rRNA (cytosine1402-N4)-methyltransferase